MPDNGITNIKATRNKRDLAIKTDKKEDNIEIYVQFNDQVVGSGRSINFEVTYDAKDVAKLKGNNLEVSLPGIGKDYAGGYDLDVLIPSARNSVSARINPQPAGTKSENGKVIYSFTKDQLTNNSVLMNFGDNQTYDVSLIYFLKNTSTSRARADIALPPSTEYQTVVYEELNIQPQTVHLDGDGNYIARYMLQPNEEKEIQLKTKMIVSAQPSHTFAPLTDEQEAQYLKPQEYWDIEASEIQKLAAELKTVDKIYEYVVNTLTYDKARSETASLRRQGSLEALKNPSQAVCMEFTDLFIAISRAAGIPAREVIGYGFTDQLDESAQTLFADNFHPWPEYYDGQLDRWVQVDPTWENTTGGQDYFSIFDTNHLAFVRRGISSTSPNGVGGFRRNENDRTVFVSISDQTVEPSQQVTLSTDNETRLSGFSDKVTITAQNTGNTAYIGTLSTSATPSSIIPSTTNPVHTPPFSKIELEMPFQIPWNQSATIQLDTTDADQNSLFKQAVAVAPIYLHPYAQIAAAYLVAIAILTVVFQKFTRHHGHTN